MTAELVFIDPYDPRWPKLFGEERELIESVIGHYIEEIEHVGSTAVPGLAAKPILDIMVGVRTLEDTPACIEGLAGIGYEYVPKLQRTLRSRRFLRKFTLDERTHHIHLVERSNHEWWDSHVIFRDYLRFNPKAVREYEGLKRDLAERFREDRDAYTDAKTSFIAEMERRAKNAS